MSNGEPQYNEHRCTLQAGSLQTTIDYPQSELASYSMVYSFELQSLTVENPDPPPENIKVTPPIYSPKTIIELAKNVDPATNDVLPTLGDGFVYGEHPEADQNVDNNTTAHSYNLAPDPNNDLCWLITVNYVPGTPTQPGVLQQQGAAGAQQSTLRPGIYDPNPVNRPATLYGESEVYMRLVTRDRDGKPIVNKAGYLYPHQFEQEDTHSVMVAEWNVSELKDAIAMQRTLEGAVNSEEWVTFFGYGSVGQGNGIPARQACCKWCRWVPINEGFGDQDTKQYFRIIARFAFAKKIERAIVPDPDDPNAPPTLGPYPENVDDWDILADEWSYRIDGGGTDVEPDPRPLAPKTPGDPGGDWGWGDDEGSSPDDYWSTKHLVRHAYDFNELPALPTWEGEGLEEPDPPTNGT